MDAEPHRPVPRMELWIQWADAHDGVRHDDADRQFDEIAQDYYERSDAYRELPATEPTGTTSATHEAFANTAYTLAPLIEDAIGRRGGDLDFYVDPVRSSTRRDGSCPDVRRRRRAASGSASRPRAARQEVMLPDGIPTTGLRP